MRTYTKFRKDIANYCNVTIDNTNEMEKIDGFLNDSIRNIYNLNGGKLRFLEVTRDIETVADQAVYQIPNDIRKLMEVSIYDGSGANGDTIYLPRMIFDSKVWARVKQSNLGNSEVPYFVYVEGTKFYIEPVPSVTGNKIRLRGRVKTSDLNKADYTTGTVTDITNDDTTVKGSGTTWTDSMIGRYIKIDDGDELWYEIDSVTSATELELVKPYQGVSISGGSSSYTIGQASYIPSAYDVSAVYRSTALYWANQNDLTRSQTYWRLYDGGCEAGLRDDYGGIIGQMIENEGETEEGAYIPPLRDVELFNNYYYPWQNASGF